MLFKRWNTSPYYFAISVFRLQNVNKTKTMIIIHKMMLTDLAVLPLCVTFAENFNHQRFETNFYSRFTIYALHSLQKYSR